MRLLRAAGIEVREACVTWQDVLEADEVFSTGNYGKVVPITPVESRSLPPGPVYATARESYWNWAHGGCSPPSGGAYRPLSGDAVPGTPHGAPPTPLCFGD